MPTTRHMHNANPVYAPPVLRAASPANSITTDYGQDETSLSDKELSDEQFARKCEERIGLHGQVEDKYEPILLPKPKNPVEEKMMHEQAMRFLRAQVKALEEEELFEAAATRTGLQTAFEIQPTSDDIDVIMNSLMGLSASDSTAQAIQPRQRSPKSFGINSQGAAAGNTIGRANSNV